jgi:hypothetical protein
MTGFLASLHSKSRVLTLVDGFVGPNPGMLTAKLSGEAVGLCTIVRLRRVLLETWELARIKRMGRRVLSQ